MKFKKMMFDLFDYYSLLFTLIFITIIFQYPLASLESIFYDFKVRFDFGIKASPEIVIVTMDEGNIGNYTYATYSSMLEKILEGNPQILNFFLRMPIVMQNDRQYYEKFKKDLENFNYKGGKVSFDREDANFGNFSYASAKLKVDDNIFSKDSVVRRAIVTTDGEDSLHLLTANQFRETRGLGPVNFQTTDGNYILFRYASSPITSSANYKTISYSNVLAGNFTKDFFENKIVLIGSNSTLSKDNYYLTPFNQEEYKALSLNIHAIIIDAFIQNKTVTKIPRMVSNVIAFVLAIALSILIARVKPRNGLIITVLALFSILVISYLLFVLFGYWFYTVHLVLTILSTFHIGIPFRAINESKRRFAIQEEAKNLKNLEKLRQNFFSLMGHDLKNPVVKIAGVADNLYRQNAGHTETQEKLQLIIDSTRELNKFISSILDLAKIESNNLGLNKVSKDVNSLISTVVKELAFSAGQKGVQIKMELAPLYPIQIDATLMTRVISNLVENAIKYSGRGSTVYIKTWYDDDWVYIEVVDNGTGIPPEELPYIFDKFYRIKNEPSKSIKGSGLGLYLVKYFVELHGGVISADSIVGKETKFLVKLINQ